MFLSCYVKDRKLFYQYFYGCERKLGSCVAYLDNMDETRQCCNWTHSGINNLLVLTQYFMFIHSSFIQKKDQPSKEKIPWSNISDIRPLMIIPLALSKLHPSNAPIGCVLALRTIQFLWIKLRGNVEWKWFIRLLPCIFIVIWRRKLKIP